MIWSRNTDSSLSSSKAEVSGPRSIVSHMLVSIGLPMVGSIIICLSPKDYRQTF